jgi:hypothetical protein
MDEQTPVKKRGRGPDKRPRKRSTRSDNPARYLPSGTEAQRIGKERGKTSGRIRGSRNGWTREEQELSRELAQAEAKLMTDFWYAVGEWPTAEQRTRLFRSISPDLLARVAAMNERRAIWLAAKGGEAPASTGEQAPVVKQSA